MLGLNLNHVGEKEPCGLRPTDIMMPAAWGSLWDNPGSQLALNWARGPFHLTFSINHNPNMMEILFSSLSNSDMVITTKFCMCHDSYAVVARAKFCGNLATMNGITLKWICHQIWFFDGKGTSETCRRLIVETFTIPTTGYTIKLHSCPLVMIIKSTVEIMAAILIGRTSGV